MRIEKQKQPHRLFSILNSQFSILVIAVLIILITCSARAAVEWSPDLDAALGRAKSEHTLVLLHLRTDCAICNRSTDRDIQYLEKFPQVVHNLAAFVLARATVSDQPTPTLKKILDQRPPAPAIVVIDSTGLLLLSWKDVDNANRTASFLTTLRGNGKLLVEAADFRAAGNEAEADMNVGRVMLVLGYPDDSRTLYLRAQKALHARGDDVHAQLAAINANYALSLLGSGYADRGMSALLRIALRPLSKENEAEVYLAIGAVRRVVNNERSGAVRAFRKALAVAPPGSDQAKAAREQLEGLDDAPLVATSASKASIRLLAPKRATITGRPFFEAEADAGVARIEFFVDDVPVASADKPPFRARLDLGRVPRVHAIKAVGYDANGAAVGEAVTTINDRADAVRVAILAPVAETLAGPTTVEADAHVPDGRALRSLELFWNESRIAAFDAPPFRAAFDVPAGQFGYFRAVATLDDGTSAEETRLVNAVGVVERVEVQGVVVPVTVVDREGKRVEGLQAADFAVTEDGRPVAVTMRDTGDEPVTIGLLIDVSGSMQRALLDVSEMANRFIAQSVSPRTKLFLAVFDSTARLVQPATSDREALQAKVLDLNPSGETSIFDGIAFGLQQFGDVPGKKALVVLTDGLEGESERDPASCIRLAKESAIPIYALIPPASFGMGRRLGNPLENITSETGGLLFLAPRWKEMPAIFDAITAEIRGQYLLTFISPRPAKRGEWRRLSVNVRGRAGVRVRTIGGYYGR